MNPALLRAAVLFLCCELSGGLTLTIAFQYKFITVTHLTLLI